MMPMTSDPHPNGDDGGCPAASDLPVYGLDIETDTTIDGLDPATGAIVAVAVASPDGVAVFRGAEHNTLTALDSFLAALPVGVLATWNGCAFDLPYLADRARRRGVAMGLHLALDLSIRRHHPPLAGHLGSYRARWHQHRHLDGYLLYRNDLAPLGLSCGLKAVAGLAAIDIVEADRSQLHLLSDAQLDAYVAADATATRLLVSRRFPLAVAATDRI